MRSTAFTYKRSFHPQQAFVRNCPDLSRLLSGASIVLKGLHERATQVEEEEEVGEVREVEEYGEGKTRKSGKESCKQSNEKLSQLQPKAVEEEEEERRRLGASLLLR